MQRVRTSEGLAPTAGCAEADDIGTKALVPYTADYFFYKATGYEQDGLSKGVRNRFAGPGGFASSRSADSSDGTTAWCGVGGAARGEVEGWDLYGEV
jgi:hypothetical protein